MKQEEPDKEVVEQEVVKHECESAFDALAAAYKQSYDSKKPILLKQIDKVLDDYLSFTEMKETSIITTHEGEQQCGTTE
jgi:hypothetical protein